MRLIRLLCVLTLLCFTVIANANDYYTHGSFPAPGSTASSAAMRAELDLITAGFNKLPSLTGNASRAVIVNGSGTSLALTTGTLSLAGNFAVSGAYATTLTVTGDTALTLPTSGTLTVVNGALGTPASITLTNGTGLPIATGVSGLGTGVATFLATPSSSNLAAAVTGETGSGALVFGSSPTIDSPTLTGTYALGGSPSLGSTFAAGGNDITGIDELGFNDASANSSATGRVRRNGGTLTWHDGVSSAPLLTSNTGRLNPIINGAMDIWQRETSFDIHPTLLVSWYTKRAYTADRWLTYVFNNTQSVRYTVAQSSSVPTVSQAGVVFNSSLEVSVTTDVPSVAATDIALMQQTIEGYNWRQYAQQPLMLSFWVLSSKTGTHGGGLVNKGGDQAYTFSYTVDVANTWEYKTVAISASPSAGTWNYASGEGISVIWTLKAGTAYHGTAGTWGATGMKPGVAGMVNILDTIGNVFRIVGVKLERGNTATPFQLVPFQDDLLRAKRYYQKSFNYDIAPAQNVSSNLPQRFNAVKAGAVSNSFGTISFPVEMRTDPTIVLYNPYAANAQIRDVTGSVDFSSSVAQTQGRRGFSVQGTGDATTAIGNILSVHWAADAEF